MKTTKFELTIGVNPGYHHNNEITGAAAVVSKLWQKIAEDLHSQGAPYVGATVRNATQVYRTEWGCPEGGEHVAIVTGLMNRHFEDRLGDWIDAVTQISKELKRRLKQEAIYLTFSTCDLVYFTSKEQDERVDDTDFPFDQAPSLFMRLLEPILFFVIVLSTIAITILLSLPPAF